MDNIPGLIGILCFPLVIIIHLIVRVSMLKDEIESLEKRPENPYMIKKTESQIDTLLDQIERLRENHTNLAEIVFENRQRIYRTGIYFDKLSEKLGYRCVPNINPPSEWNFVNPHSIETPNFIKIKD